MIFFLVKLILFLDWIREYPGKWLYVTVFNQASIYLLKVYKGNYTKMREFCSS